MSDIFVFICEDEELAKELVQAHFERGKLTAAFSFGSQKREAIKSMLEGVLES